MFTYTRHALLTLLLLAPISSHSAEENPSANNDPIERLMQVSGLKHAIDSFPQEIKLQINQQKISNPDAALTDEESNLLFSQFNADRINQTLKQHLYNTLDNKTLDALLNMHDDPLMKRIITAEIASSSENTQQEMAAFIDALRIKPPSESRHQLIQQLDQVSMSTESVIYIVEMVMLGMSEIMMERDGTNNDANRAKMHAIVTSTIQLIEDQLREQIVMSMHYIYRDFSDAEITHYTEQLRRNESQQFTRTAIEGIGIVIFDAFKYGIDQLSMLRNARAA